MTKISNEFYQRWLTTINFLRIFGETKLEKIGIFFFKFLSISIHAIPSGRRQERVSVHSNSLNQLVTKGPPFHEEDRLALDRVKSISHYWPLKG